MLNIFCPFRGRENIYGDFIDHYHSMIPDSHIYILEQNDKKMFKRGQLMNVAFNALMDCDTDLECMLFIDIDIRMKYLIPFEVYLKQHSKVVIPFNQLSLCEYAGNSIYKPLNQPSYFLSAPDGGVTLFTKEIFQRCNGFSNLYIGWGREDSDFVRRNQVMRLPNEMIHLEHERHGEWATPEFQRNDDNFKANLDPQLDGYKQTTAQFEIKEVTSNVFHCKISDIGVVPEYIYKSKIALGS
jgi:predicted glycosyltransferase involved in capsule biosynthesis